MLGRKRLLPTGFCWCGCGEEVGVRYFFKPGHDKQAEARLIMEVFGGIPQFLHAFGRGPDQEGAAPTEAGWVYWAMKLAGLPAGPGGASFVIEYLNEADRTGRFKLRPSKVTGDHRRLTLAGPVALADGVADFALESSQFQVPLVDLDGVRREGEPYIIRVHGTFEPTGSVNFPESMKYVSLARG